MKLAVSQIAWQPAEQEQALSLLRGAGYAGLEIAPTLVAGPAPYADVQTAADFAAGIRRGFGLSICSMQSIWYGKSGTIFGPECDELLDYTKKAVLFAEAAGCGNLVFGCPKNRVRPAGASDDDALPFFEQAGAFAAAHGAVLALEANPPLYGTNFINTTREAFAMAEKVACPGFKVNLDVGTMVENGEAVSELAGLVPGISHVHISEPNLVPIVPRALHRELAALLREENYAGWVSIEMKAAGLEELQKAVAYVAEVFGEGPA